MTEPSIFVASLFSETARRDGVREQFVQYGLVPEFIDAVDMRDCTDDALCDYHSVMRDRKVRLLRATEIGCALTHLNIAKEIITRDLDFALVVEDDVVLLSNPKVILDAMPDIVNQCDVDMMVLGYVKVCAENLSDYYHRLPIKVDARLPNHQIGRPWKQKHCGAVAYILTREGAQKLVAANTPICYVADAWDVFAYQHHLHIKHVRPAIAIESQAFQSTNGNESHSPCVKSPVSVGFHSLKSKMYYIAMNYLGISPK